MCILRACLFCCEPKFTTSLRGQRTLALGWQPGSLGPWSGSARNYCAACSKPETRFLYLSEPGVVERGAAEEYLPCPSLKLVPVVYKSRGGCSF